MSDTLDDKLKAVADSKEHDYQCAAHGEGLDCCIEKPEIIVQIKQAIPDAGYLTPEQRLAWHDEHFADNHMTGQEWYDRLKTELINVRARSQIFQRTVHDAEDEFLLAARRAAGLDKETD